MKINMRKIFTHLIFGLMDPLSFWLRGLLISIVLSDNLDPLVSINEPSLVPLFSNIKLDNILSYLMLPSIHIVIRQYPLK